MKYCIYCHQNIINGKRYVGITSQKPEQRWRNGKGYINNAYFYRAIEKYGWHNFRHDILYTNLTKEEAENLEIKLIKEFDSANPSKGYNIELGGNSTEKFSDEIKKKISNALKGHACSEETRQKISKANKGKICKPRKLSAEQIEKLRIANLGRTPWNKNRPWTSEEKAKCGGKAVCCVETGVIYKTAHEAGEALNLDFSSICKCAKGKSKTVGGYHWQYAKELTE